MIHYHGTPIACRAEEDIHTKFFPGRHALIPFPRKDDLVVVENLCKSFIFDNGAFSAWKNGERVDFDAYTRWCDKYKRHPRFDFALIPDVIDGNEEENDALLREWPKDIRGVPVYHLHESLGRAEKLVREYPVVAIGSSGAWKTPKSQSWWSRMATILDVICDEDGLPYARLHGLRQLDPAIFSQIPYSSCDSTTAGRGAGMDDKWKGPYSPMSVYQRANVIADRIEHHLSATFWERPSQILMFDGHGHRCFFDGGQP